MNWMQCTLDDVLAGVIDYRGKTPLKTDSGIRLVTAKVIKQGRVINDGAQEYIEPKIYDEVMRRGIPQKKDIFITTEAPLGELALWNSDEQIALAQRVILLRPDPVKIDQQYLFYYLQSAGFQAQLHANATGTTVPGIKNPVLRSLVVRRPSIEHQRVIGHTLANYDDLIETNRRRIALLEESARLLYREWFVNLRFPGHEQVKRVDGVPDGWKMAPLTDVAAVNRASISGKTAPETIRYIDIASVETGVIRETTQMPFTDAPGRARRLVRHGDVIWSCVRPNRKSYALVWQPSDEVVVSTGFAVLTATAVPFTYLYLATTTEDFVAFLTNRATGAAYPAVTAKDFEAATILKPDEAVLNDFYEQCDPIFNMQDCLQRQNEKLTRARDALLPKLMSGEIRV